MSMATVLSVFFIPVLYFAIETLIERIRGPRAAPTPVRQPESAGQRGREEGGGS
jgi:hypothetical protein